ncbi:MAG TPA: hypothetical protein VK866_16560, partial [Acidimicrobiales bacterium]|nr:hypothetical protein [Acidimicrobiales bacterium]
DAVWYVAYGSNLDEQRFRCYLEGGRPEGRGSAHHGARDRTPPRDDRAVHLDHCVVFSGRTSTWGPGGVAHLVATGHHPTPTRARAWLVTLGQLEDVIAQETGRISVQLDLGAVVTAGEVRLGDGRYDRVVSTGDHDGVPQVTLAWARPTPPGPVTLPSEAYLRTMARGLRQSHGMDPDEIESYFGALPGICDDWPEPHRRAVLDVT